MIIFLIIAKCLKSSKLNGFALKRCDLTSLRANLRLETIFAAVIGAPPSADVGGGLSSRSNENQQSID